MSPIPPTATRWRHEPRYRPRLCENVISDAGRKIDCGSVFRVLRRWSDGTRLGAGFSGALHRFRERPDAQDDDHSFEIVGENLEAHFCSDLFEGLGQKVGRSHPRLDGPEWMFGRSAADAHAMGCAVQPFLHRVKDGLVLPALDATLLSRRALRFERAARAFRRPVTV